MTGIDLAYAECRRIARASGSSFYAGMRLLQPERRGALFAVYALARRIDDIADGELPGEEKLAELATVRARLHDRDATGDPVLAAVLDAATRYPIPLAAFDELIEGAELDTRGREYSTFAELEHYCRCVAGSIGRLSLGVFDCVRPRSRLGPRGRARSRTPDRQHPARRRRGRRRRPALPAAGRPRALRLHGRRRDVRRADRARDRLRGRAGARAPPCRPRPRAAARPPQRLMRPRDGRQVPPPARADRRGADPRLPRQALAPLLGEGPRPRPQPRRERHERPDRHRRRWACRARRRGRVPRCRSVRDALRGPVPARGRHVLVRAKRAVARQRPARRASLLHRLPRLPAPARRRASPPAPVPAARPGPARGRAAGAAHPLGPSRSAPPRRHDAALRAALAPRADRSRARSDGAPQARPRRSRRSTSGRSETG